MKNKISTVYDEVDVSGEKRAKATRAGDNFEQTIIKKIKQILLESNYELYDSLLGKKQKSKAILFEVKKDGKFISWFGSQNKLFEILKKNNDWVKEGCQKPAQNVKNIWSKDLKPDLFFFNEAKHKLTIIELKFQNSDGSVDEKIQTAVYKREMWSKLFSQYGISVEYKYIMGTYSFWTKVNKRKNVNKYLDLFEWLKKNNIPYFLDEDPETKYSIKDFID